MIHTVTDPEPLNLPEICKEREVAVNSSHADIRILLTNVCIDNICGGVILPRHQERLDQLALFTVF